MYGFKNPNMMLAQLLKEMLIEGMGWDEDSRAVAQWTPTCQNGVKSDGSPMNDPKVDNTLPVDQNNKEEEEWDGLQWSESEEEHNKDKDNQWGAGEVEDVHMF